MYTFKKKAATLLAAIFFAGMPFAFASADTVSSPAPTVESLTAQIHALLLEIQYLEEQINAYSSTGTASSTQVIPLQVYPGNDTTDGVG